MVFIIHDASDKNNPQKSIMLPPYTIETSKYR